MRKRGKRWITAGLAIIIGLTMTWTAAPTQAASNTAANDIQVFVNKQRLVTDTAPYVVPKVNVTMIPFRAVGEAIGAEVYWNQQQKEVTFKKDSDLIVMTIDKDTAIVNGEVVHLDAAPQMKSGRTMVPLRFVGENLGITVQWDQKNRIVTLLTESGEEQQLPNMRATWVSSVYHIDWPQDPRKTGYDREQQQADYIALLDQLSDIGLNTVFVQIRPTADAFYPSQYLPWSEWLTGTQGVDPGYDPLAFMIEETHKRGMQFHAWFNPYRVSVQADLNKLTADHPARQHPEWVVKHANKLMFDPGIPEVQEFIIDTIMEVVTNYDIDGVHFDDYFYPYGQASEPFQDDDTYKTYNKVFNNKEAWRRQNVNQFIQAISEEIRAEKPYISFGISPYGVWRNASVDPTGSATKASVTSYDSLHADVRMWIEQGWIDYVAPQIYWHIGHSAADYATLVDWWVDETAGTGVDLYIGHASYKLADEKEKDWNSADVLIDQLVYNEQYMNIAGDIFFSAKDLLRNTKQVADHLREYYELQED